MNNTKIELTWKPCRRMETYKRDAEDGVRILAFDSLVKLNPVGGLVWEMSNGKRSIGMIIDSLSDEFPDISKRVLQRDVVQILEDLEKKYAIILNWDPLYKSKVNQRFPTEKNCEKAEISALDVLFIQAPSPSPGSNISHRLQGMPPLGLGYLATWLASKDYTVKIIDLLLADNTFFDVEKTIFECKPKIVAISTSTESYNSGIRLASLCRKADDSMKIVMGGYHVTFEDESAISSGNIDFVVRHEGELVLENLCNYIIRGMGSLKDIKGISYLENGEYIKNVREPFIADIDRLPFPDRNLFEFDRYPVPGAISTSRGCVGNCIFCAATALSGGTYRVRSADSVIEEMKYLKALGIEKIQIVDDTMTADVGRLTLLLNKMIENNLNISWGCESRVDIMNRELLLLMKEAGCVSVQFGVEAGNQKMIDRLRKNITIEQIRTVFKWCKELNISTGTCLMIGQPHDDNNSISDTVNFATELKSYGAYVVYSISTPFPGTYMYTHHDKLGLSIVEKNFDYYNTFYPVYNTQNFSQDEIRGFYYDALITLFSMPRNEDEIEKIKARHNLLMESVRKV